jgi:hypothetical protein
LAVFRDNGEVRATGTSRPVEHFVEELQQEWARRET